MNFPPYAPGLSYIYVIYYSEIATCILDENGVFSAYVSEGRAVIEEHRLRGYSEAELRCEETFANWEEAEEWVQEILYQLEQSYVTEYLLGVLIFSIEVYQRVLDSKIEPKMVVLLEELKTELSLVLP
jgi:hypothetical protein